MKDIKLDFTRTDRNDFSNGTKKVSVINRYEGNNRVVIVYYYDSRFDEISHTKFQCCHAPSRCKNEESAIRMINRFFSSSSWYEF